MLPELLKLGTGILTKAYRHTVGWKFKYSYSVYCSTKHRPTILICRWNREGLCVAPDNENFQKAQIG